MVDDKAHFLNTKKAFFQVFQVLKYFRSTVHEMMLIFSDPLSGDLWDGDQHVPLGTHHVCVRLAADHSLDGPDGDGLSASERQLQHQHRQSLRTGECRQSLRSHFPFFHYFSFLSFFFLSKACG